MATPDLTQARAETRENFGPHQSRSWDTCRNGTPYRTRSSRGQAKPGHVSPSDLLPELRSSRSRAKRGRGEGGQRSSESTKIARRNQVERIDSRSGNKSSELTSAAETSRAKTTELRTSAVAKCLYGIVPHSDHTSAWTEHDFTSSKSSLPKIQQISNPHSIFGHKIKAI